MYTSSNGEPLTFENSENIICDLDTFKCKIDPIWNQFQKTDFRLNAGEGIKFIDNCNGLVTTMFLDFKNRDFRGVISTYNRCNSVNGSNRIIIEDLIAPGDLGYDFKRDIIIVPQQIINQIKFFKIKRNENNNNCEK